MTEKHWTEPNGIFIINIPANWQYKNAVFENIEEKSPYSFEQYENSAGCFQLSCYPLSERGVKTGTGAVASEELKKSLRSVSPAKSSSSPVQVGQSTSSNATAIGGK